MKVEAYPNGNQHADRDGLADDFRVEKPVRFQCATVNRDLVRRLRVLAALNDQTLAHVLDSVLKAGLPALEAVAKGKQTES